MSEDHSNMTKDSEKKKTEFEKLVEVCQMALHLFKQTEFQQAMKQNNMTSSLRCSVPDENICSASFIKFKPPGMVSSGEQVSKRSCTTARGDEPSSSSYSCRYDRKRTVAEHDYLNDKKVWSSRSCRYNGKRTVAELDYLNDKKVWSSRSCRYNGKDRDDRKVFVDRKGKRKLRCYYDEEEEEEEDSDCPEKRRLCKNIMAKNKSVQVASLPLKFKNRIREMGGDDVKLIIQKHMFAADVAQGQNRFSIPINQVREDAKEFLTEEEISRVPMELPFIEPNLDLTRIVIRKWNYSGKSSSYALSGPWSAIRTRNNLQAGLEMQLWSFRVHGDLNLALVEVLRDNKQDHQVDGIARTSKINAESRDQQHDIAQFKSRNEADRDYGHVPRAAAAAAVSTHDQMDSVASTSKINAESRDQQDAIAQFKSTNEADRDGGHVLRDADAAAISTHDQMETID
ncbi:hypothetical protein DCAR_0309820 [Daucus carota subsp. sativus]|uniref:Uncharacterized protein n=1 Tax=Daucus carota subsp. sativus TaxID=79200 RepID=A0A165ZEP4_DAUCS|nr:hypothetical protein DCAR_0309820 [Daucus carota subsp. sativus]